MSNNIEYSVLEICDSSRNEIIDVSELSNEILNNEYDKSNEIIALELFYTENYTVKELTKICGYYNISVRNKKKNKLVEDIVMLEINEENNILVSRRKLLNFYYEELKNDDYYKSFVI